MRWLETAGDAGDGGDGVINVISTYRKLATTSLVLKRNSSLLETAGDGVGCPGWSGLVRVGLGYDAGPCDRVDGR